MKTIKIATSELPKSFLSILHLFVFLAVSIFAVFALSLSVSALSGNSSDREIAEAVCRDDPNAHVSPDTWNECIDRTTLRLNRECDYPSQSEEWVACREGFLFANTSGGGMVITPSIDADCTDAVLTPDNCAIIGYIRIITDALSVLVGVVVVMMLVIGGIQYSSAGSNPQAVAAAKKRISQALFALLIYIFMAAFLQWLVPGGIL